MKLQKPTLKLLALVAGGGAALASIPGYFAYQYTEHSPEFCTTCHLMNDAYGRWAASEHNKIECHDCHITTMAENMVRLYYAVVDPKSEVETHAEVDRTVCLKCHESQKGERWQAVLETAGHRAHPENLVAQCVDCHNEGVHRFIPGDDVCGKCHKRVQLHETGMAEVECLGCHDFLADTSAKINLRPTAADCRRCHGEKVSPEILERAKAHPRKVEPEKEPPAPVEPQPTAQLTKNARPVRTSTAGIVRLPSNGYAQYIPEDWVHGGVDCRACHNPHGEDKAHRRTGVTCARCHKGGPTTSIRGGPEGHQACSSCHAAHAERERAINACKQCHPGRQATKHPNACATCHRPHVFTAAGRDCNSCHSDVARTLYNDAPKKHDPCNNCHDPHEARVPVAACSKCHTKQGNAALASAVPAHRTCADADGGCHQQHGPKPSGSGMCAQCHKDQAHTTSKKAPHDKCRDCHQTVHGTPETKAAACQKCHKDQTARAVDSRSPLEHRNCASCHKPHQPSLATTVAACTKCHQKESSGGVTDAHNGDCKWCHQQHGPPTLDTLARCGNAKCHDKVQIRAPANAREHRDCKSCHVPHGAAVRAPEACQRCHKDQKRSLEVFVNINEHQKCTSCHIGHEVVKPPACGKCHEKQLAGMQGNKHKDCSKCHNPHKTTALGKAPKWKDCARCHDEQAKAVAARGSTHGRCQECHEPHSFKPPSCDKCHTAIRAQLMHRVPAHQKCKECHDAHKPTRITRDKCLTCHEQKKADHYPEASRCDACHPFSEGAAAAIKSAAINQ